MTSNTGSDRDDDMESISEDDSKDDSIRSKSKASSSLRKQRTQDSKGQESSHSKTENLADNIWIQWVTDRLGPSGGRDPAPAVTTKSPGAPFRHDQCGINSTSDLQNKGNTTIGDTNKRARGPEDSGNHGRKAKTARHEGSPDMINDPSVSTLESRPAHATEIESLRAPFAHDQGTTDMTADTQAIIYTAAATPASDQDLDSTDAGTVTSDALGYPNNSIAQITKRATRTASPRKTGARGSSAGPEIALQIPASGM